MHQCGRRSGFGPPNKTEKGIKIEENATSVNLNIPIYYSTASIYINFRVEAPKLTIFPWLQLCYSNSWGFGSQDIIGSFLHTIQLNNSVILLVDISVSSNGIIGTVNFHGLAMDCVTFQCQSSRYKSLVVEAVASKKLVYWKIVFYFALLSYQGVLHISQSFSAYTWWSVASQTPTAASMFMDRTKTRVKLTCLHQVRERERESVGGFCQHEHFNTDNGSQRIIGNNSLFHAKIFGFFSLSSANKSIFIAQKYSFFIVWAEKKGEKRRRRKKTTELGR